MAPLITSMVTALGCLVRTVELRLSTDFKEQLAVQFILAMAPE